MRMVTEWLSNSTCAIGLVYGWGMCENLWAIYISIYIYAFSGCFYLKWLMSVSYQLLQGQSSYILWAFGFLCICYQMWLIDVETVVIHQKSLSLFLSCVLPLSLPHSSLFLTVSVLLSVSLCLSPSYVRSLCRTLSPYFLYSSISYLCVHLLMMKGLSGWPSLLMSLRRTLETGCSVISSSKPCGPPTM